MNLVILGKDSATFFCYLMFLAGLECPRLVFPSAVSITQALKLLQLHRCQLLFIKTPICHLSRIYKWILDRLVSINTSVLLVLDIFESSCMFLAGFCCERRALRGFLIWSQHLRCCIYTGSADPSQFSLITAEDEDTQHLLSLQISPGGRLNRASASCPARFHLQLTSFLSWLDM